MVNDDLGHDPTLWSAMEQAAAIRARRLGSEELLDLFLARIDAVDPAVNAVCTLDVGRARVRCRAADAATAGGDHWGPLHGLPITVKDAIDTEGVRTTGGAVVLRDRVAPADAPAVARLKAAGAIVFGKTNLPEWSGDWQSFNEMFGTTNNPWALDRTCGGSSGGAAAAVACGMTSFELGTDIGGSVRVPSAFCGVYGHKPSCGVIPTFGYLDEPHGGATESDVNTFGPITRSAADLRVLFDILAGPAGPAATAWRLDLPTDAPGSLGGVRIGAWLDDPALECDAEMVELWRSVADAAEAAGAVVDRSIRPAFDVDRMWKLGARLIGAAVGVHGDDRGLTHQQWLLMDRERVALRAAWAAVFECVDVVLCPVTLIPAFPHQQDLAWDTRSISVNGRERRYLELEGWPALVGAAYLPSTSAPVGRTRGGLPVGVQVVAPLYHDRRAIAVADALTRTIGGYGSPPIVASP